MSEHDRAIELLDKARELGCNPVKDGSWIKFNPPLPPELIMEAALLGNELHDILNSTQTDK